jgi:hypothetical protein
MERGFSTSRSNQVFFCKADASPVEALTFQCVCLLCLSDAPNGERKPVYRVQKDLAIRPVGYERTVRGYLAALRGLNVRETPEVDVSIARIGSCNS